MDGPRDCYIEWNVRKRKTNIYEWIYMESRKVVLMNHFPGRNGDGDIKEGLVDTEEEGEGGMNWESNNDIYTLPCVKKIASGKLPYNTGSPVGTVWQARGVGWEEQRGTRGRVYIYI